MDPLSPSYETLIQTLFYALQGTWKLHRKLTSHRSSFPSGTFTGTASFGSRSPSDSSFNAEYLYIEEGTLATTEGLNMRATRRYVYRYDQALDEISVWFVKDDATTVDYLFLLLEFKTQPASAQLQKSWSARGDHQCVADLYKSVYAFDGESFDEFRITHTVNGPEKDYVIETWYQRDSDPPIEV